MNADPERARFQRKSVAGVIVARRDADAEGEVDRGEARRLRLLLLRQERAEIFLHASVCRTLGASVLRVRHAAGCTHHHCTDRNLHFDDAAPRVRRLQREDSEAGRAEIGRQGRIGGAENERGGRS